MSRSILLFLFSIGCSICLGQHQVKLSEKHERQMDSVGLAYLEAHGAPGMAIGVLKGDNILYSKGLGTKNKDTGEPVTNQTVFHMASVSKPFVSTGIMLLVEQGKVDIKDKVTEYLPYFELADKRYTDITVEQLMLHTAGIPDVGPSVNYEWDKPQFDDQALERHVKSLATKRLDFKPGRKKPSYSNNGYEILGDIIAKASGTTFENFMQEGILEPTEMSNSSFLFADYDDSILSKPHVKDSNDQVIVSEVYPYNRKHAPSSCLHSSVEDMLKFAMTNMNKGEFNGKRIFSESSYNLLVDPQVRENKIFEFGLGWTTASYRDTKRIEFTGGDTGFHTVIIIVPSYDFAIVILINGDFNPPAFDVINTAFEIAIKH